MRILTVAKIAIFIIVLGVMRSYAIAPLNDAFASAETLPGSLGEVFRVNVGATREAGEPVHALNRGGASVWFRYVAPGNGVVNLSTNGSDYNTLLAVYTGSGLSNLKLVASNDDFRLAIPYSRLTFGSQANTTYYIAVDGYNDDGLGADVGNLKLSWRATASSPVDAFESQDGLIGLYRGQRVESNVGATKQAGEPNHAGNSGGKSVWFRWSAPTSTSYTFSTKGSVKADGSGPMYTLLAIYSGSTPETLTPVVSRSGLGTKLVLNPVAGQVYRIAVDGFNFGQGADAGTVNLTWRATDSTKDLDFDGDDRADISLFRPTTGVWYTHDSISDAVRAAKWGVDGDVPIPGRYDIDDRIDYNIFRPGTGTWWTLGSAAGTTQYRWGLGTDIPFLFHTFDRDYTGVFRPSDGNWHIYVGGGYTVNFGLQGDIPVPADYDGDGHDNIAIFRPSTGTWWFLNQMTGAQTAIQFGLGDDIPIPADFDADGIADLAVYRPSDGNWYIKESLDGSTTIKNWGMPGDVPQPADYTGDGSADIAVFRPSNGIWYIRYNEFSGVIRYRRFGLADDRPITFSGMVLGSE